MTTFDIMLVIASALTAVSCFCISFMLIALAIWQRGLFIPRTVRLLCAFSLLTGIGGVGRAVRVLSSYAGFAWDGWPIVTGIVEVLIAAAAMALAVLMVYYWRFFDGVFQLARQIQDRGENGQR